MENKPIRILLIEDNAGDARLIQEQLKEVPEVAYVFCCVPKLQDGLEHLSRHETDIVLSDLSLPDSPGLETFKRLQSEISGVPVVVVTGFDNESSALDAVREGAQDYLIKGQVNARGLSRTILYAIERYRTQSTLRSLSLTDELTGLYNRRGFITLGEQALKSAQRAKSHLYLYFADLDGLKKINDTFGHPDGDRAIAGAAEVLRKTFRQSDIVARIGGDEFAALAAEDQTGGSDILISRLMGNLSHYNLQNPHAYKISISVGVTRYNPEVPVPMEELLSQADKVLYVSKEKKHAALQPVWSRKARQWTGAALAIGLLSVAFFGWQRWKRPPVPVLIPGPRVTAHPLPVPVPAPAPVSVSTPSPSPKPVRPPAPVAHPFAGVRSSSNKNRREVQPPVVPLTMPSASADWKSPTPPAITLHQELIPRAISIARFTYQETILPPDSRVTFTIVGSGFTPEFQKVLEVYSGSPYVQVKDLRLATINEVQGDLVIHPDAPTQYVFPRVLINDSPVFQASNPFAIIRQGDVLNIVFTKMDENGHAGHFRVYTNLDPALAHEFHIAPSAESLEISPLEFNLPYRVEGVLRISDSVPRGDYGLLAFLGAREVFRKDHLIQITRPTLGSTGFVQKVMAQIPFRRPGDTVDIVIQGSGFTPGLAALLKARVDGQEMGESSFRYISPGTLQGLFTIPAEALQKSFNVSLYEGREVTYRARDVFTIVPPNWIENLDVNPPARPGKKSLLKVVGRDFSRDFAKTLRLETDDPGIHISRPEWMNPSTLSATLEIDDAVNPGDYVINLKSEGVSLKPQGGNLVTIGPSQ